MASHLVMAQDTCADIKKNIQAYESFIQSCARDSICFLDEVTKYSTKTDKESQDKYQTAKSFLAIVATSKATAIENKMRLEKLLVSCKSK